MPKPTQREGVALQASPKFIANAPASSVAQALANAKNQVNKAKET